MEIILVVFYPNNSYYRYYYYYVYCQIKIWIQVYLLLLFNCVIIIEMVKLI